MFSHPLNAPDNCVAPVFPKFRTRFTFRRLLLAAPYILRLVVPEITIVCSLADAYVCVKSASLYVVIADVDPSPQSTLASVKPAWHPIVKSSLSAVVSITIPNVVSEVFAA